jgi:hypothetical protein
LAISPGALHRGVGRLLAVAGLLLATTAAAEPGDHIRVGDAVITPDLEAGFEYRTNVYHEEENPQGGGNLRIAPGLEVVVEGEDARFSLASEYEARKQVFVEFDPAAIPLAERATLDQAQAVSNLDRWSDFSAQAAASLARQTVIGLELADQIAYRNQVVDSELSDSPFLTQFKNALTGQVRLSPTGAVQFRPGGFWTYDDFRVPEYFGFALQDANEHEPFNVRNTYGPSLSAAWSFFPNTAWVIDAKYAWVEWREDSISSLLANPTGGVPGQALAKPDSNQLRVTTGLRGRITPKFTVDLQGGYGQAIYDENSVVTSDPAAAIDTRTFLLVAQVGWQPKEGSGVSLGYRKDFEDIFFTNYVSYHQVFLQANTVLDDRLDLLARYGIRLESYVGAVTRHDTFMRGSFETNYHFSDWAALGATVWWQSRFSDDELVEYDDVGVLISATFQY